MTHTPTRHSFVLVMLRRALLAATAGGAFCVSGAALAEVDFSGLYFPSGPRPAAPNPPPFTPGAKAAADAYREAFTIDDDPGRYCIWPGMPRAIWGAPFTIEIQQRPQDITIFWEGYGMYRKIYMADHNPPQPLLASAMGHSVAHWEGDTLVIETTHLKPYPYMTRLATSSAATIVERWHLEDRGTGDRKTRVLVDEFVLTDPKVYTEPLRLRGEATQRPDMQLLEYTCTDTLWDDYLTERGLTLPDLDALPDYAAPAPRDAAR